MTAEIIKQKLLLLGNPKKADKSQYFFKTSKGQYGEGDVFIGTTVPENRSVAKEHKNLQFDEIAKLLNDEIHECRLCALLILVEQFKTNNNDKRKQVYDFYLTQTHGINNWDLVDLSCYFIVGQWLLDKDRAPLYQLAESTDLWEQRIAIVSTMAFVRNNDFEDTLRLVEKLMNHDHDLIHKACGWLLREAGKRDENVLTDFLDIYSKQMPRTMLRYSIEKLTKEQRAHYMKK